MQQYSFYRELGVQFLIKIYILSLVKRYFKGKRKAKKRFNRLELLRSESLMIVRKAADLVTARIPKEW